MQTPASKARKTEAKKDPSECQCPKCLRNVARSTMDGQPFVPHMLESAVLMTKYRASWPLTVDLCKGTHSLDAVSVLGPAVDVPDG